MNLILTLSISFVFITFSAFAHAAEIVPSCLPAFTAVNAQASLNDQEIVQLPLFSENSHGMYKTKVEFILKSKNNQLQLALEFPIKEGMVSKPFSLYRVLIFQKGELIYHSDYTDQCSNFGLTIWPNNSISLDTLKNIQPQNLNVVVWGRH